MITNESSSTSDWSFSGMERIVRPVLVVTSGFLSYAFWTEGSPWLASAFTLFAAYNLFSVVKDLRNRRRRSA